ncbi:hypothetical protein HJG60_010082 [Phyllostomus discolor]|uniref:Uncharacterized protein n=1 Tax=Phyllostomus discolor TaxID=89673 RepID=A0A834ASA1_9CHIR|nr:hypothetical protein HJG60_010082 [Phyllostomus discolor]
MELALSFSLVCMMKNMAAVLVFPSEAAVKANSKISGVYSNKGLFLTNVTWAGRWLCLCAVCGFFILRSKNAFVSICRMINLYYVNYLNKTFTILKLFRTFTNTMSLSRYYSEPDWWVCINPGTFFLFFMQVPHLSFDCGIHF